MRANQALRASAKSSLLSRSLACLSLVLLAACDGSTGNQGSAGGQGSNEGDTTPTAYEQGDTLPGIVLAISEVTGGSGTGGNFLPGDTLSVHYTAKKSNGTNWNITEFGTARILVSGPTSNYQRVLAEQTNLATASVRQADGSYLYTFTAPIPTTYLAPLNDTVSFGLSDGELQGQPLQEGTYTVGMYVGWNYTLGTASARAAGDAVFDFLIGNTGSLLPRELVLQDNCNRCHESLQAHGGLRRNVTLCLLCHTAGAEDKNVPGVANGTPGVTIEFKVMIHKIHNGEHLPSVLGVGTNLDGTRNYAATPQPYQMVGFGNSVIDFSSVAFPAWPQGVIAMPRDSGYSSLSAGEKSLEDTLRTGVSSCYLCHGDPDGDGPLGAPAQGDIYKTQPTEAACGACHDDIVWGQVYNANTQSMPDTADNSNCILCHTASGASLSVEDAHIHPLQNPSFNPGVNIEFTGIAEAGTNDDDGTIDPGEKIVATFSIVDDTGADITPSAVTNISVLVAGPTNNYNFLLSSSIPVSKLVGSPPYTVNLPAPVFLERVGVSTGALESFTTALTPHWNVTGAATSVLVRTATAGGNSTLASDTVAPQNYLDVASATNFARDDYIVVDDGTADEEYVRIQYVDGTRLWFGQTGSSTYPFGLNKAHSTGATVKEVTLTTKTVTTNYTLDATTGTITEVTEFGNGNVVLCSYTTDYVMPSVYPVTINDTATIDETWGKWSAKPIVDGTYSVGLYTTRTTVLSLYSETNSYRDVSDPAAVDFLVGDASTVQHYSLISSDENCNACHQTVYAHGSGRAGFTTCILCHGAAGMEDRPQYVAANAPATDGVTPNFRTMLHKIHAGAELAHASSYEIVGFGSTAYPNNFGIVTFEEVEFPVFPSGVKSCAKCHGTSTAWQEPANRAHPTDQVLPMKNWAPVCGSCHDADDAQSHISAMTSAGGVESCGVCHGSGAEINVPKEHKVY
ncbi:MAG: hypothetical protein IPJ19_06125 [Planctomycetes bacterium]|nr:hypothetical protein [Planctomycetota bacterium]